MIWAVQTEHMGDVVVLPRVGSKALAWSLNVTKARIKVEMLQTIG